MLKVGIAGCGAIARAVHIPLLRKRAGVEILAFAESDAATRASVQSLLPGARACETLDEMLAGPRPDAVIIALPTGEHGAAARLVLDSGCDVYVEKPLASSLTAAEEVVRAWRASDRIGMTGFNARFNPLIRRLRELLRSGRAGTPVYAQTVFSTAPREQPGWKQSRASAGGVLLDLAVHHIDLVRFLFDREPVTVRATIESRRAEDDTALLELELEDGPRVHCFSSLCASELERIEVLGDRARLGVSRFTSLDVAITENPGEGGAARRIGRSLGALRHVGEALRARRSPLREPGYGLALDVFLDGVRTRRLPPDAPDLIAGLACNEVIDAAERSARSGATEAVRRCLPSLSAGELRTP